MTKKSKEILEVIIYEAEETRIEDGEEDGEAFFWMAVKLFIVSLFFGDDDISERD